MDSSSPQARYEAGLQALQTNNTSQRPRSQPHLDTNETLGTTVSGTIIPTADGEESDEDKASLFRGSRLLLLIILSGLLIIAAAVGGGLAAHFSMSKSPKYANVGASTSAAFSQIPSTPKTTSNTATQVLTQTLTDSNQVVVASTSPATPGTVAIVPSLTTSRNPTLITTTSSLAQVESQASLSQSQVTATSIATPRTVITVPSITTVIATTLIATTLSPNSLLPTTPPLTSNPCANTAAFTTSITWAGISQNINPPQVYWEYDLISAQKCCEHCWNLKPQKCNVWGHFPYGHPVDSGRDSCAIVYDYHGSQQDNTCPAGRPMVGILPGVGPQKYFIASNVGGVGPCAGIVYSVVP